MKVALIVPAAGAGRRLGGHRPKALRTVLGKPLLVHTLAALQKSFPFSESWVAVNRKSQTRIRRVLSRHGFSNVCLVPGGATRARSVFNALLRVSSASHWVLVHDAARPLVRPDLVRRVLGAARRSGAALCTLPVISTLKRVDGTRRRIVRTEDRRRLVEAQTPQVFRKDWLRSRFRRLGAFAFSATDEAALFDRSRVSVRAVPGDPRNIKITTPGDLELFKFYSKKA